MLHSSAGNDDDDDSDGYYDDNDDERTRASEPAEEPVKDSKPDKKTNPNTSLIHFTHKNIIIGLKGSHDHISILSQQK